MSEQYVQFLLVKVELLSKMLLYNVNQNSSMHYRRGAYSQSSPHWQSIGYRNFNQARTKF